MVGGAILPVVPSGDAFQTALSGHARKRRLKAGGSQDWLPHSPRENGAGAGKLVVAFVVALAAFAAPDPELDRRLDAARELKRQGSAQKAAAAYEALVAAFRGGADRKLFARVLLESSEIAAAMGDYTRAIDRATESARVYREEKDQRNEALAINYIGQARLYLGDYAAALADFNVALDMAVSQHDAAGEIVRRNNIGSIYFFQGKYLDALQSYERALARVEGSAFADRESDRQLTLANLAIIYEQLGQNQKSLEYYQQALAALSSFVPSEQAQLLSNVGTLYRRMGDPVKALENYRSARQLFARGKHSDGEIHILYNIGIVLALDYGNLEGALAAFTEALTLAEATSNRRQVVLGHLFRGEALYRMGRNDPAREAYRTALAKAEETGAAEEQWTANYGLARIYRREGNAGPALEAFRRAIAQIESVRSGLGQSSLKAEFLANKREVYDGAIDALLATAGAGQEQLFELFEQARSRNLQDALRKTMPRATLPAIRNRLGPHAMLIEYWVGNGQMAILWTTRDRSAVVRRPIAQGNLERLRKLTELLHGGQDAPWRAEAEAAAPLLLEGIPIGSEITELLIVPDGALLSLPFELLPAASGGPLLIERVAVSYLPSAALLLREGGSRGAALPWERQLLAFGDPLPPAAGRLPSDETWVRLPDAAREIESVARALGGRSEIHAGADDLKRRLVDGRPARAPLLHFSTHAAVDTLDPNRSRILFTPESGNAASQYLFWREVQDLSLNGVELVTLSACDTEGGKMVRGEGIQSFSRAFLAAGAGATVTTLWRVADGPTADFMRLFYAQLAHGAAKAEALRSAKLSFLRSGSELAQPRYWAAFVLNGDGQSPVRPVLSWAWVIAAALLVGLALGGARGLWKKRRQ